MEITKLERKESKQITEKQRETEERGVIRAGRRRRMEEEENW